MKTKKEIKYWNGVNCPEAGELFVMDCLTDDREDGEMEPFLCYSLGEDFEGGCAYEPLCYVGGIGYYISAHCYDSYPKTEAYLGMLGVANGDHLAIYYQSKDIYN